MFQHECMWCASSPDQTNGQQWEESASQKWVCDTDGSDA